MGTSASQLSRTQTRTGEQRLSIRKVVSHPIPIELESGKAAWLHDLSEGGLSVSGSRLELGISANFGFRLPDSNYPIHAAGRVAWSHPSGRAGVRFTGMEPDSTLALQRWLESDTMINSGTSTVARQTDAELEANISCLGEVADLQAVISAEQFDCAAALDLIARRMAELTRASGAAIALREGQDVVCRARAGNAPDVGVKLSATSLSGGCLETGTMVALEDSDSDARVDPELCRQLNFRSLLILPIASGTEIIGIAEVLSPNPRNFAGGDILVLSFLADLIASVAAPRLEPDANASAPAMDFSMLHEGFEPEEAPIGAIPVLTPAASIPFLSMPELFPSPPLVAPAKSAFEPAISVPALPVKDSLPAVPAPRIANLKAQLANETEPRIFASRMMLLAAVVVVLVAAVASLAGYYFSRRGNVSKTAGSVAPTSQASGASATPAPAATPNVVGSPSARSTQTQHAVLLRGSGNQPAASPTHSTDLSSVSRPETAPPEEIQIVRGETAQANSAAEPAPPEAPAIGDVSNRSARALEASIVATRTATPALTPSIQTAPVTLSQGVTEGRLLKKVLPRYPDMARRAGVAGDVVLTATIATDGTLRGIKAISGSPLLREEAIAAAKQWRYSPYKLGGKPVETDTRITMSFHR